jgi:hypothetical protein
VLRALGERIEPVDVEGEPYWARAQDVPELVAAERVRVVRLLPAFDQYVIAATRQVDHLLAGGSPDRVYRAQGWLSPVLLIDGMLAGVWRAERVGKRPAVSVEPFLPVSATTRESVRAEVDRLTAGQGLPAEVEWRE